MAHYSTWTCETQKQNRVTHHHKISEVFLKMEGGLMGLCDGNGRWMLRPQYSSIKKAYEGSVWVKITDRWLLCSYTGEKIGQHLFEQIGSFVHDYAKVKKENAQWGVIDKAGRFVLPPLYEEIFSLTDTSTFVVKKSGRYGMINIYGQTLVPFQFKEFEKIWKYFQTKIKQN